MTRGFLRFLRGNTIALLALFIALGGTTYAATALPKNSVGTKQLKKNAVTAVKIKNGAVTNAKIAGNAVTGAKVSNDSLTGADVLESSLGTVPSATNATNATHATTATTATNATNAMTAANATNATNAANSAKLEGKTGASYRPVVRFVEDGPGALDLDASPVVCQTAAYVSTGSEVADLHGVVSLLAGAGAMTGATHMVVSTDGGTSWNAVNVWFTRSTESATGEWGTSSSDANLALTSGTSYIFGIQVTRINGVATADASDSRCNVTAAVYDQ